MIFLIAGKRDGVFFANEVTETGSHEIVDKSRAGGDNLILIIKIRKTYRS